MKIVHPFTFVPFPETLAREPWPLTGPAGHERHGGSAGAFECELTAVSPLCLKEHFGRLHAAGAAPYLTGSSLKGMLRNTLQILGYGCVGQQFQNKVVKRQEAEGRVPPLQLAHMVACMKESACLVCRVFGYGVEEADRNEEERAEAFGWAGKICIHDSGPLEEWRSSGWCGMNDRACRVAGRQPAMPKDQGARHWAFYYPFGDGRPAGWKIYRHSVKVTRIDDGYASSDCVSAGTKFASRLEYSGMSAEELAALEFGLALSHQCEEPGHDVKHLVHKIGYGKGVGLGGCRIEIKRRDRLAERRYFGAPPGEGGQQPGCHLVAVLGGAAFAAFTAARKQGGAELLLFPTWDEFRDRPRESIPEYDARLAAKPPEVYPSQSPRAEAGRRAAGVGRAASRRSALCGYEREARHAEGQDGGEVQRVRIRLRDAQGHRGGDQRSTAHGDSKREERESPGA